MITNESATGTAATLSAAELRSRFVQRISRDFARRHLIAPCEAGSLAPGLLIAPTSDPAAVFNVRTRLADDARLGSGTGLPSLISDAEAIALAIDRLYEAERGESERAAQESGATTGPETIDALLADADRDLLSTQGKGHVVRLVDVLLFDAVTRGASDVHVQPLPDRTLVRYRIDGVLLDVRDLSPELATSVVSRIKLIGEMDIAERRTPQDGRATMKIGRRSIDLRISTIPTSHGERAVIRLLDTSQQLCDFDALGMPADIAEVFLDHASRTSGIVLVTGPTGSGKTTTLYSTLRRIGSSDRNVMTIEDPIEYELTGGGMAISQSQVNAKKGLTFATGLRHILRQDPDVIMVGEIRDHDTASIAIQSSLTGHLVFSTLHTNDSPSAVTRLVDLGVEPYLVAASLSAVLAQRLVRSIHRECEGRGCDRCLGVGLRGRTGVFELLPICDAVRDVLSRTPSLAELRHVALAGGMRTLAAEGERLVAAGVTTTAEMRRVLHGLL